MERFYDNDPDKENEPFFGESDDSEDEEGIAFIDQQGIIDVMQLDLAQNELSQQLLAQATDIASQSWFWRFKSVEKRMAEIEYVYNQLLALTNQVEEETEEDEEEE